MKIKNKILIGISVMLILLIIVLSTTMYHEIKKSTELMVTERLSDQVKSMSAIIKQYEKMGYSEEKTTEILREMFYNDKEFPKNLNVKLAGKGFIFIMDKDGTNIIHPALEGKNLVEKKKGFKKIYTQRNGMDKYISPKNGKWKITVFSDDVPYGWIISSTAFKDMIINEHVMRIMKINLFILITGLVIFIVVIALFVTHTIKPLEKISNKLHQIASGEGDLTATLEVRSNDEIGEIAIAFNQFLETIKNMIIEVSNSSQSVNEICVSLENISLRTQDVFDKLNHIIGEIVTGSKEQKNDIVITQEALSELSNEITQIYEISSSMKENSIEIQNVNELSKTGINNLQESSVQSVDASNQVSASIKDLYNQIDRISQVSKMIKDISDQTNLLALNASIEAARAGEVGKGFAVVANEVSKLAEESNKYSQEISEIINDIEEKVSYTNSLSQKVLQASDNQSLTFENSKKDFSNVSELLDEMLKNIKGVDEQIVKVETNKADIINYISRLSDVSEEVACSTEEVSDLTDDFNKNIMELSNVASKLRESSDVMINMISRFKY